MWRPVFDGGDSKGPHLKKMVRTEQFADAMALFRRLNRRAMTTASDLHRRLLAFWNVPSARDVADLTKQLAAVHRQLHQMNNALTEGNDGEH